MTQCHKIFFEINIQKEFDYPTRILNCEYEISTHFVDIMSQSELCYNRCKSCNFNVSASGDFKCPLVTFHSY